ncbi:hypothetical protein, partial [Acinetobacter baumannii]|uniref:hypothetical protein n=1 Tax=Acinetobacter baumannii TaxID=470 RepID=UPI001A7EEA2A
EWTGRQVAEAGSQEGAPRTFAAAMRDFVASAEPVSTETTTQLRALADALSSLSGLLGVSVQSWKEWSADPGVLQRWSDTERERRSSDSALNSLRRWLALRAHPLCIRMG